MSNSVNSINNIFQVVNEAHLDEILNEHQQGLTVLMLSSKVCEPCKMIKPVFIQLSKQNSDCIFVYIDRKNAVWYFY